MGNCFFQNPCFREIRALMQSSCSVWHFRVTICVSSCPCPKMTLSGAQLKGLSPRSWLPARLQLLLYTGTEMGSKAPGRRARIISDKDVLPLAIRFLCLPLPPSLTFLSSFSSPSSSSKPNFFYHVMEVHH